MHREITASLGSEAVILAMKINLVLVATFGMMLVRDILLMLIGLVAYRSYSTLVFRQTDSNGLRLVA